MRSLLLLLPLLSCSAFALLAAASSHCPNVLVILADAQGGGDLPRIGNQNLDTPDRGKNGEPSTS